MSLVNIHLYFPLQSLEEVKREIARLMNPIPESSSSKGNGSSTSAAGGSSSSRTVPEAEKPKAKDISHLIKRKKPDTVSDVTEESPAKKAALE